MNQDDGRSLGITLLCAHPGCQVFTRRDYCATHRWQHAEPPAGRDAQQPRRATNASPTQPPTAPNRKDDR